MGIKRIEARSLLSKTGIPGFAYAINPYRGCTHGCVYCYARYMRRFSGHQEPWGEFLDAKVNAAEVLYRELAKKGGLIEGGVFLSSVTDPYLPAESIFRLTRGVLEVLLEYQIPLTILTKSDLVVRDIDLLAGFSSCIVGLSIMTTDETVARRFEPRAPSPQRRIAALKALKEKGIATYAFISPFLPHLSNIEELLEALEGAIDEFGIEALNTREDYWWGVARVLARNYPDRVDGYKATCRRRSYWDRLEQQARGLAAQLGISFMGLYRH